MNNLRSVSTGIAIVLLACGPAPPWAAFGGFAASYAQMVDRPVVRVAALILLALTLGFALWRPRDVEMQGRK
jgi:cobalamin synthase